LVGSSEEGGEGELAGLVPKPKEGAAGVEEEEDEVGKANDGKEGAPAGVEVDGKEEKGLAVVVVVEVPKENNEGAAGFEAENEGAGLEAEGLGSSHATHFSASLGLESMQVGQSHLFDPAPVFGARPAAAQLNPPPVDEDGVEGLGAVEEDEVEVEVEEALAVGLGSSHATHFSTSEALEIMHVGQSHLFEPPAPPPEGLGARPAAAQLNSPPAPPDGAEVEAGGGEAGGLVDSDVDASVEVAGGVSTDGVGRGEGFFEEGRAISAGESSSILSSAVDSSPLDEVCDCERSESSVA
jgi:hypothetical protein